MKPRFIGIGVQKAATSWLHDLLGQYSQISVSEPKELDFFSYYFDRGYEWYEHHFDAATEGQICGETSPSYLYNPAVPARVKAYAPDMRLIAILRDPVARAFSNHLHEIRKGHLTSSEVFEDGLKNNPAYTEQGFYFRHLSNWLASFDREQVLVLVAEDIERDPKAELERVLRHIGLEGAGALEAARERSHESVGYRAPALGRMIREGGKLMRKAGLGQALKAIKGLPVVEQTLALNRRDLRRDVPKMREETRAQLIELFADDLVALPALLGRTELPWASWRAAVALRKGAAAVEGAA